MLSGATTITFFPNKEGHHNHTIFDSLCSCLSDSDGIIIIMLDCLSKQCGKPQSLVP